MQDRTHTQRRSFFDLYAHNFVRAALVVPKLSIADPTFNAHEIVKWYTKAEESGAAVALFPELCLSGYATRL
jgi:NAD+ synthase (glutamine-hydrolysing)